MFMEAIYLYVKFQQSGDLSLNVSEKKNGNLRYNYNTGKTPYMWILHHNSQQ